MNVGAIDLNLLVVFDALLAERNVTRAAARVGLSQPAFSNALARLRLQVDDALFVRTAGGMVPTSRALEMASHVRTALREVDRALNPPTFDVARATGVVSIALNEYVQASMLPALQRRAARTAPRLALRVVSTGGLSSTALDTELAEDRVDLVADWVAEPSRITPGIGSALLLHDAQVCIARGNHPEAVGRLTLSGFAGLRHVAVAASEPSLPAIEAALARLGLHREVGLTIPTVLTAPWVVARSDLVAMVPRRMASWFAQILRLTVLELPFPVPPAVLGVKWHDRLADKAAASWVKSQLQEIGEEMEQNGL